MKVYYHNHNCKHSNINTVFAYTGILANNCIIHPFSVVISTPAVNTAVKMLWWMILLAKVYRTGQPSTLPLTQWVLVGKMGSRLS